MVPATQFLNGALDKEQKNKKPAKARTKRVDEEAEEENPGEARAGRRTERDFEMTQCSKRVW